MPKYKNISGGALDVEPPGQSYRVEDGETVDLPDVQPDGESPLVWNPRQWEPVTDTKAAKSAGKADG